MMVSWAGESPYIISLTNLLFLSTLSISVQKRSCITATCLLHTLLQTLSANENMGKSPLLPYNMGFKVYDGRHKFRKN